MDEHEYDPFDPDPNPKTKPQKRMEEFLSIRSAGTGAGQPLPANHWPTLLANYRARLDAITSADAGGATT
jgi:hypothetical protein